MATKTKLENTHRIVLTRPLYVGVGVTDFAVEAVRGLVSDAQARANRAQKRLEDLDAAELREQATRRVNERVEAFGKAAEETQEAAEKRISELQDEVRSIPTRISDFVVGNVEAATDVYVDLAKRGESLVTRVRRQESTQDTVRNARTTKAKAKTTRTQAKKTADKVEKVAERGAEETAKTAKTAAKSTRTTAKKAATSTKSTAKGGATKTANTAKTAAKKTADTATKSPATSSAKATQTSARKTVESATKAASEAAAKVGD